MVLRSSDLGGARVTAQGYYRDTDFPSVISYAREFEDGRVADRALYVDSEAEIGRSVQERRASSACSSSRSAPAKVAS
jgi:hypothetical protein